LPAGETTWGRHVGYRSHTPYLVINLAKTERTKLARSKGSTTVLRRYRAGPDKRIRARLKKMK
ncbi:MAG: hypothetical protein ACW985_11170, partial [Candidatus Thorarchaeota archaeon]